MSFINKRPVPLYLMDASYPLWLTKQLLLYKCGEQITNSIDWAKSKRNCLMIKRYTDVDVIKDLHFFYPDGELFIAKEDPLTNENEELVNDNNDAIAHVEFWFDD
nr:lef-6 [Darna trima granulovirus]